MSKKILFCAALVLAIFAGAAQKRQVMLDRVVAVVGGSSILWAEGTNMRASWWNSAASRVTLRTAIPTTKRSNNC